MDRPTTPRQAPDGAVDRVRLRPVTDADHAALLELNAAEVPRLGPLDAEGLTALLGWCDLALVAELAEAPGRVAGFVLAVPPRRPYASPNYRFFEARGRDHLYVDRIATAPFARRRGVAGRLSDAVEDRARARGRAEVTCEVNLRPPNPGSLAFHRARGFVEVAQHDAYGGEVRVSLLAKPV